MSAGRFIRSRYIASYNTDRIHPIRVQPETLDLAPVDTPATANSPPSQSINEPISAVVSLGQRALGLRPRLVTIELVDVTPPPGYDIRSRVTLPVLNLQLPPLLIPGTLMNYLDAEWEVVSFTPEGTR